MKVLNNTNVVIQRSCLSRERIGEMTISAGTYLSEKFLDHPDEEVCTAVNNKVQEYMEAMTGLCREEASLIMCRSLTGMFKGLHSDILADCEFSCLRKQESSQRDSQQEQPQQDQQYDENSTTEEGDEGKKIVYSVMMALKLNKSSRLPLGMILILMRWKYARLQMMNFHDDITKWFGGDSSHSVLIHKTGVCSFNVRYSQFRKQMDRLKSTQTKDLVFSQVPREKYVLLQQTFRQLNHHYVRWLSGASALLHRHFYAAVAEALTTVKHMPALDNVNEDGTNKSETKTPGKSASVGPATPNMPKADDSVAATGRTLRSSTTSAIVHQLVMLLICLLKRV
uniref:Uncharacterized protein n=1 Tax=Meloidogyne incognita TaxID=6306 RepID=A0A914L7S8_MELIC